MDVERIFSRPKVLRALTSLDAGEFARLLELFEGQARRCPLQRRTWNRQKRRRSLGAGNLGALPTGRTKPLFILCFRVLLSPGGGNLSLDRRQP